MNKWFFLNAILLIAAIWQVMRLPIFPGRIPILIGFMGILFFLFNWTRHAVFSTIRDVPDRNTKIKFAKLSKKAMPFHKWTGTTALFLIIVHATWIIYRYGFTMQNGKWQADLVPASC